MGTKDRCPTDGNTTQGDAVKWCKECNQSYCQKCGLELFVYQKGSLLLLSDDKYGWRDPEGHWWREVDTIEKGNG